MRLISIFMIGLVGCAILSGCNREEGGTNAPEDSAFQKSLADAAAKNGNKPANMSKGGGAKPPADAKTAPPVTEDKDKTSTSGGK